MGREINVRSFIGEDGRLNLLPTVPRFAHGFCLVSSPALERHIRALSDQRDRPVLAQGQGWLRVQESTVRVVKHKYMRVHVGPNTSKWYMEVLYPQCQH